MPRADGRANDELRPVSFELGIQPSPPASVLVRFGGTAVVCSCSHEDAAPPFRRGRGWLTGEYAMLPGATTDRARRERRGPGGRSKEIERLIGRSLRAVVDLDAMPEATLTLDADVLVADGGTRTAAITGGYVALAVAMRRLGLDAHLGGHVAAVSVGIVDGEPRLDLPYEEDGRAETDMNVVGTADGRLIEVQGTAEQAPFTRDELDELLDLAVGGLERLFTLQTRAIEEASA